MKPYAPGVVNGSFRTAMAYSSTTLPSLREYGDACMDLLYRELVFCYPHPELGTLTPAKELSCDAGFASCLDTKSGHHCYSRNGEYVPFN